MLLISLATLLSLALRRPKLASVAQFIRQAVLLGAALMVHPASALTSQPLELGQFDHTAWTASDGAPVGVTSMVQDRMGVLWLIAPSGIFTFDGYSFSEFVPPVGEPDFPSGGRAIAATPDGAIWIGFSLGGVSQVQGGHVVHSYGAVDGLPPGTIDALAQSPNGEMLALVRGRVYSLSNGHWMQIRGGESFSNEVVRGLFVDKSKQLYVLTDSAVWVDRAGDGEFTRISGRGGRGALVQAGDGSTWRYDIHFDKPNVFERIDSESAPGVGSSRLTGDLSQPLWTTDGTLWIPSGVGLYRTRPWSGGLRLGAASMEGPLGPIEGLSSTYVFSVFEDRAGDVWASTDRGVDRFRRTNFVRYIGSPSPVSPLIAQCPSNKLWMTFETKVVEVSGPEGRPTADAPGDTFALYCDKDESLWLATETGLFNLKSGHYKSIAVPVEVTPLNIRLMVESAGTLYVSVTASGLWRYRESRWTRIPIEGVAGNTPTAMTVARDGSLWCGFVDGSVRKYDDNVFTDVPTDTDNPLGAVQVLVDTERYGLVAGGVKGLAVMTNGRFRSVSNVDRSAFRGISGLVMSRAGDLWVNSVHGISVISASEISASIGSQSYAVHSRTFVESTTKVAAQQLIRVPSASVGNDGVLWFASINGLVHIDPQSVGANEQAPQLNSVSIWVDDEPTSTGQPILPGYHRVRFHFIGVHLEAPEQVTYRYKLDGLDVDWRDGVKSADAYYSGLKPGTYRFRVLASNGDGAWSTENSALSFRVLPAFYQTKLFVAACSALGALAVFALISMRLRKVEQVVRRRAEDRANERVKIARDLHDTLLQGMQGLMLRFHVASQGIEPGSGERLAMETALLRADELLTEGRNRVTGLRVDEFMRMDLATALAATCEALANDESVRWKLDASGGGLRLKPAVSQEISFIGREALTNAFRHGQPANVFIHLRYDLRSFKMTIVDDGTGFNIEADVASLNERNRWGIAGMKERAQVLSAGFYISSDVASGTSVELNLPGWRAYDIPKSYTEILKRLFRFVKLMAKPSL